jgi:hypothetical protein
MLQDCFEPIKYPRVQRELLCAILTERRSSGGRRRMANTACETHDSRTAMSRGEPTKTIGNARAAGETRFTVHCGRIECGHRAELAFDEIRLPDETIFVHSLETEAQSDVRARAASASML